MLLNVDDYYLIAFFVHLYQHLWYCILNTILLSLHHTPPPPSLTKDVDLHIQCLLQVAVSRETDSNIQQQQHTHCRWMPCLKSMRDYTTTWSIENTTRSQVFDTLLATCNSYENNDSGQDVGTSATRPKGVGYMY